MLKIEHITTGYGKKQVLTDVSFDVKKGEIILLTGGNGSGKSTVLKCIYGLLKPWNKNGKIVFEGENITELCASEMIKRGIVYMPQKKNVFEDLTVEENLLTSATIYSKREAKERVEKVYEMMPQLAQMKKRTPFNMSGGEKQLLAFGSAVIHSPKLILLDEPFAGIDVEVSEIIKKILLNITKMSCAVLLVEHKKLFFEKYTSLELKLGHICISQS